MAVKQFSPKPKKIEGTHNPISRKIAELNGHDHQEQIEPKKQLGPGRPKKEDEEKTIKKTITLRPEDLDLIDKIVNELVDQGVRKPFPTDIDIHRIGFLALEKLSAKERYQLFTEYKPKKGS